MISRRTFLQQAGAAASTAPLLPMTQTGARYKLGLQLYTLRAALARDVEGTLARIAAMGYQEVETYGFDPARIGFYGLDAKVFAERLRAHGLTAVTGHFDLNQYVSTPIGELTGYVDRCIEGALAIGQSYITWPYLDPPDRTIDRFKVVAERLNLIGARIRKAGLQLAYHNHDFEFLEHDGRIGYDIILADTDPDLVKLQIDLYWIARASKRTAHEWFLRQPGRFVMWHVKDMHTVSRDYTEVGNGSIDFSQIWPHAALSGMKHYFVEQGGNFTHDPFRSVADSAEYVKRHFRW